MKKVTFLLVAALLASGLLLGTAQAAFASFDGATNLLDTTAFGGNGYGNGNSGTGSSSYCDGTTCESTSLNLSTTPLSSYEEDSLIFMVEEEKLARDVYLFLADKWNLVVFSNIAVSEQAHMDSLITLIDRYGLTNPASSQEGVFTNSSLQSLYNELIAKGGQSLADALLVGGAIEEIDIRDLQTRLTSVTHFDISQVFNNLLTGSYNHLKAFANEYNLQTGETYVPQYLDATAYQTALDSSMTARGPVTSRGSGTSGNGRW